MPDFARASILVDWLQQTDPRRSGQSTSYLIVMVQLFSVEGPAFAGLFRLGWTTSGLIPTFGAVDISNFKLISANTKRLFRSDQSTRLGNDAGGYSDEPRALESLIMRIFDVACGIAVDWFASDLWLGGSSTCSQNTAFER